MKYITSAFVLLLSLVCFAKEVPRLSAPVVDEAQLLKSSTRSSLNSLLKQVSDQGQLQMAILIVTDLEDETLEGHSIKVVDKWKLGSEKEDNGLLLLIAKNQRKMRLEVGQGLEGVIPDALAGRIISEMTPFFKQGQFDEGVLFAVAQVFQHVGIKVDGLDRYAKSSRGKKTQQGSLLSIIFFIIFFLLLRRNPALALLMFAGSSRRGGGGYGGGGGFSGGGGGFSGGGASGGW